MTTDGTPLPSLDAAPLQFDTPLPSSETATPQAMSCGACSQPIQSVYYETAGQVICARCRGKLESRIGTSGKGGRMLRAVAFGIGAAIAGALVYYGVVALTGWTIGILGILVGFMVGKAVFVGSGHRGGRAYQALAAVLTYFAIASTYIPMARDALKEKAAATSAAKPAVAASDSLTVASDDTLAAPADSIATAATAATTKSAKASVAPVKLGPGAILIGIAAIVLFCAALPVIAAFGAPISFLILCFAIVQAWRMNQKVALEVTGPYRLAPSTPSPEAAA